MRSKKAIIQNWNDLYKQLSIDFTQCFTKNIVSSPDRMVNVSSFVYNIEKKLFKCKWRFLFGAFVSSSCVFLVSRLIHKKFWSRNVDWRLTLSFRLNPGGQVVGQGRYNMEKSTKRRQRFKYFGNHLDTMLLLIASMVSGKINRITHNRRKDFDQGSWFRRKTSSHCSKWQTKL